LFSFDFISHNAKLLTFYSFGVISFFVQFLRIILPFQFEADRRAIIITINSFGTELTKDDRAKLYPRCGKLHPDGLAALARADDYEQVKAVAEYYAVSSFIMYLVTGGNSHCCRQKRVTRLMIAYLMSSNNK